MTYLPLLLVVVVAILEVIGDILFKEWTIGNKTPFLLIGILLYFLATICWAFSLKYQDLSKAVIIFAVITSVVAVLVGVLVYKESPSFINIVGIVLGLIGVVLLEI